MRFSRACFFFTLVACGSRTELGEWTTEAGVAPPLRDAGSQRDAVADGPACAVACAAGEVCIHDYYTHDPPPPLPDGGVCTYGTQRYDRCWGVTDRCSPVPRGCVTAPSCSCPSLGRPQWPEGCECNGDGSFDCYSIGI